MKKEVTLPSLFVFVLTITILITMRSWFSMSLDLLVWSPVLAIMMLWTGSTFIQPKTISIGTILLCLLSYFTFTRGNINAYIGSFSYVMPFLVFCCFKPTIRYKFLFAFNKIFAVIVAISTFFWILHLIGVPLLHFHFDFIEYYSYENYIFFLDFQSASVYLSFFPRFFSIFVEPSIIGMLCVFMITLDGFRLKKWYNIVYLIALILSFSLAGFVLFAFALIPHVLYGSGFRSRFDYLVIVGAIIAVGYYAMYVADQTSVIYQMFGQRLEWNEDTGTIAGYDRSDQAIDDFLVQQFWNSDKVFFGYGSDLQYHGVDWKVFLAKYGVVSLLLYALFLFYCYMKKRSKYGLWWFLIFFMAFCRGYSVMFWPGFLMIYLMGVDYLSYCKDKKLNAWNLESV